MSSNPRVGERSKENASEGKWERSVHSAKSFPLSAGSKWPWNDGIVMSSSKGRSCVLTVGD